MKIILESILGLYRAFKRADFTYIKREIHTVFLASLIVFCIFVRIIPPFFIGLLILLMAVALFVFDFIHYFEKKFKEKYLNSGFVTEYSWGIVRDSNFKIKDISKIYEFFTNLPYSEYKEYFKQKVNTFILILFILGDLLVAFKNLSLTNFGIYAVMSVFTKVVFFGYYYFNKKLKEIGSNDEDIILDVFYSFFNLFLTCAVLVFVFLFLTSKLFVTIFFGGMYLPYHTTLPFVFVTNMSMCIALVIYETSKKISFDNTKKIEKIYGIFLFILFTFMTNPSIDSVTYFAVGVTSILSIFLYNLIIKKPAYIKNTYNHLF